MPCHPTHGLKQRHVKCGAFPFGTIRARTVQDASGFPSMIEKGKRDVGKQLYLTPATAGLDLVPPIGRQYCRVHVHDRPLWPILEITAEI